MNTHFAEERIDYTGEQLQSQWAGQTFGIQGDSIVAFLGACDVKREFMVDLVDLESNSRIYSPLMLHFIAEHFGGDLENAVLRQRLLGALACEYLRSATGQPILRRGDDLYLEGRKISVSVATVSPVSVLIHFGINVQAKGVPVPACGLEELGLEPERCAHQIMRAYVIELTGIKAARTSAKPVK